ncbi:DJ-1 family glyoxalase III [Clostridium cylindrosporum]|uniref:DJ-1 family protein n=1 Tax=Clostridium cylindrosporum DSM 605 TaxID=1121307 RepID=A0A0J8D7M2_CLOCY|nr:DJ-1 family glyoxalase III [Clostridium cylindrosporum]KMT21887.1 DJ-1 family protein [Clostridium cylindrosporum DSM 605]
MVYVHLANGLEEIETITIVDILRRAGVEVKTVSIMGKKEVTGAWGVTISSDLLFEEVDYSNGDMIVLPGGGLGTENLKSHAGINKEIMNYHSEGKWVAAICAAPMVFGSLGILKGREAVCYPGCEEELTGAILKGDNVVVDKDIITSKGPGTAFEFALKLVEVLKGIDEVNRLKQDMIYNL